MVTIHSPLAEDLIYSQGAEPISFRHRKMALTRHSFEFGPTILRFHVLQHSCVVSERLTDLELLQRSSLSIALWTILILYGLVCINQLPGGN